MQNSTPQKPLDRVDSLICRIEKNIAGSMFFIMSLVVLADVIHRVFSRSPGRISSILAPMLHSAPEAIDPWVDYGVIPVSLFLFAFTATQSRARALGHQYSLLQVVGRAIAGCVGATVLVGGFIKLVPSGLVWSPYFGLCCLLWLGLLGASIATHHGQHLALEMGEKLWPEKLRPAIGKLASFLVGCFCAFIAILAFMSVKDHYTDWSSGPGAGLVPSIEWPKWAVYLVIPYSFFMMAVRFLSRAIGILSEPVKLDITGEEIKS